MSEFVLFVSEYALSFFLYSFLGWLFEVVYTLFLERRLVNRGFLYGPLCPIYGVGALMAIFLLGPIQNPVVAFFVGSISAGVVEYATSVVLERLFHARWWDYSNFKINLNGRVCLAGLVTFGVLMLVVKYLAEPLFLSFLGMFDPVVVVLAARVLVIVLVVDLTMSIARVRGFNRMITVVQSRISEMTQDLTLRAADVADSARGRASGLAQTTSELLERIRLSATSAAERVRGLSEEPGVPERRGYENWKALYRAKSLSELADALSNLAPEFMRNSRHELNDPSFHPTRFDEAWEVVRSLKDSLASKVSGFIYAYPEQSGLDEPSEHADEARGNSPAVVADPAADVDDVAREAPARRMSASSAGK